ncbi:hypothetical protein CXF48_10565 [Corynebacterium bovis]|uniref:Uncharacterized protein n=1 Tax=Corynebacterium bovis TaxID=36808 RepID=A0A426PWM9_9CORY|nr:hypothetical protein CXF48_10565 [Corynebacterium bovis]
MWTTGSVSGAPGSPATKFPLAGIQTGATPGPPTRYAWYAAAVFTVRTTAVTQWSRTVGDEALYEDARSFARPSAAGSAHTVRVASPSAQDNP